MSEEIYILYFKSNIQGYVKCRAIAQWWSDQREDRSWCKLEPKYFSDEEARKIVDAIIIKKEEP
jgi:hypothetical protein